MPVAAAAPEKKAETKEAKEHDRRQDGDFCQQGLIGPCDDPFHPGFAGAGKRLDFRLVERLEIKTEFLLSGLG